MRIVIGSDHAGFPLKSTIVEHIKSLGHEVTDVGSYDPDPVDFPDVARNVTSSMPDRLARYFSTASTAASVRPWDESDGVCTSVVMKP